METGEPRFFLTNKQISRADAKSNLFSFENLKIHLLSQLSTSLPVFLSVDEIRHKLCIVRNDLPAVTLKTTKNQSNFCKSIRSGLIMSFEITAELCDSWIKLLNRMWAVGKLLWAHPLQILMDFFLHIIILVLVYRNRWKTYL